MIRWLKKRASKKTSESSTDESASPHPVCRAIHFAQRHLVGVLPDLASVKISDCPKATASRWPSRESIAAFCAKLPFETVRESETWLGDLDGSDADDRFMARIFLIAVSVCYLKFEASSEHLVLLLDGLNRCFTGAPEIILFLFTECLWQLTKRTKDRIEVLCAVLAFSRHKSESVLPPNFHNLLFDYIRICFLPFNGDPLFEQELTDWLSDPIVQRFPDESRESCVELLNSLREPILEFSILPMKILFAFDRVDVARQINQELATKFAEIVTSHISPFEVGKRTDGKFEGSRISDAFTSLPLYFTQNHRDVMAMLSPEVREKSRKIASCISERLCDGFFEEFFRQVQSAFKRGSAGWFHGLAAVMDFPFEPIELFVYVLHYEIRRNGANEKNEKVFT
jgi:hypothetical protein